VGIILSRDSVLRWLTALGLALVGAAPAGATVRTAAYTWTPATGPVAGYALFTSVDGGDALLYTYVSQTSAVIEVDSSASLIVSVAAFDSTGTLGPRSDASAPLRLCPGDFDGDQILGGGDLNRVLSCIGRPAEGGCVGRDLNDDGRVAAGDYLNFEFGADACPPLPPPAGCPGDVNGDGWIRGVDVLLAQNCRGLMPLGNCTYADFDRNGYVSLRDVTLTSLAVGTACSR